MRLALNAGSTEIGTFVVNVISVMLLLSAIPSEDKSIGVSTKLKIRADQFLAYVSGDTCFYVVATLGQAASMACKSMIYVENVK